MLPRVLEKRTDGELARLREENAALRTRLAAAELTIATLDASHKEAVGSGSVDPAPGPPNSPGQPWRGSEETWRAIFNSAPDALLLATDAQYVDANASACELLGMSHSELVGRPQDEWASPGSDSAPQAQLFPSNGSTLGYFSMLRPDGTTRTLEYSTRSNIVPGLHLSIFHDITERRRAEEERLSQEGLFQQAMDAIGDMVFVKGPGSRLLWGNKAFCEAYGMSSEELTGLVDAPFVPPEQTAQYVKDDEMVFATGRPLNIPEESVTRHDGRTTVVHTVKSPIFDSYGKVSKMVGVSRDVTEQRKLEADLRQAQKLEAVGALASGIAHEINTPIQFIGDQAQFLKEAFIDFEPVFRAYEELAQKIENGIAATPADVAVVRQAQERADASFVLQQVPGSIGAIQDGASRVARLVQAMKEFGHPDSGAKRNADLNRALGTTLILANNQFKYVAEVETDFGELVPVACWLSELNQVFLNVLVNAGHAIADVVAATPGERGKITVVTRQQDQQVVISIGDTGGGIPEAIRDRIFEPFFTTKEVGRGTGQGLAIARRIVDRHGGSLTFETVLGKGTTFHIRIPVSQVAEGEETSDTAGET